MQFCRAVLKVHTRMFVLRFQVNEVSSDGIRVATALQSIVYSVNSAYTKSFRALKVHSQTS